MWDAKENYWFGHEWDSKAPWQPTTDGARNNNYPESNADGNRWYHENSGPLDNLVNPLFSELPNANEVAWYVMKGNAHWDERTRWKAFGKPHTGGVWLKKLSVIAKENNKQLADLKLKNPEGIDMRTTYKYYAVVPIPGKPNDREIDDYFFLPALGAYKYGKFWNVGYLGDYWTSSAIIDSSHAYNLGSYSDYVYLYHSDGRQEGYVAQPFE